MRVVSLASGSSGNALLVEAGPERRTKLLIDAGINTRLLCGRLLAMGVQPAQLRGILVTHEHSDHVIGVPGLMQRYAVPVVTDPATYQAIEESLVSGLWRSETGILIPIQDGEAQAEAAGDQEGAGKFYQKRKRHFVSLPVGSSCVIGDMEVTSFPVSHDASAPCGYLLHAGGCRVCVVTDTGEVTAQMLACMQQADLLILEANHDRVRLLRGPYPYHLKQRILSLTGHLSNDQAVEAVLRTWRPDGVRWLWLAHLSRTNNTPALALKSVRAGLQDAHADLSLVHISVAPPGIGPIWDSTQLWQQPMLWEMPS
jgi:phosphoribosyl 1,2-cyclic phosphodiesterase